MLSKNQIAGFLNHLFLQYTSMKQSRFLHVINNLQKLKVGWKVLELTDLHADTNSRKLTGDWKYLG